MLATNRENSCNPCLVTVLYMLNWVSHHKMIKNMIMRAGGSDVLLHHQRRRAKGARAKAQEEKGAKAKA
jgi:hypothetical protein